MLLLISLAAATTPRWEYEAAYDNSNDGDWYRDADNSAATLAWGESYVLMSLAAMFRATGDPVYLDRLDHHLQGVYSSRDDQRGVSDYRGVSGACWQNTSYQSGGQAYCYVVHTGMLIAPMAEFARGVHDAGLQDWTSPDGETYGDKADRWTQAAVEGVAAHEHQWNSAGYYAFASDADFLSYTGVAVPYNQSHAMGRALVSLYQVTGDDAHLAKVTAMANRFHDGIDWAGGRANWNYWGGTPAGNGEDISHAAINVDFAVRAHSVGAAFVDRDLVALGDTFTQRVMVDDATVSDAIHGGPTNGTSYRPQAGRWAGLSPAHPGVYTAIYDLFSADYPGETAGATTLLTWALLAEHELPRCQHFFYSVDWDDQGDWRQATAYGANVLATASDSGACMVPVVVERPADVVVEQWDGSAYHPLHRWAADASATLRHIPLEPRWTYEYWEGGVLFQFSDDPVAAFGIRVAEPEAWSPPTLTSTPETDLHAGGVYRYDPTATGDGPLWWSLVERPIDTHIDFATGEIRWHAHESGPVTFTLHVANDAGVTEQTWTVTVAEPADTGDSGDTSDSDPAGGDTDDSSGGDSGGGDDTGGSGSEGCGCGGTGPGGILALALLAVWRRRRA